MAEHPDDEATRQRSEPADDTLLAPTRAREPTRIDLTIDDTQLAPTVARPEEATAAPDPDATVLTRSRGHADPDATVVTRARQDTDQDATV
ncbi:MAG: hypothetical protein ACKOBM_10620, partial [Gammaproteobacteria bacterium]